MIKKKMANMRMVKTKDGWCAPGHEDALAAARAASDARIRAEEAERAAQLGRPREDYQIPAAALRRSIGFYKK